ncbi:hypothetical protein K466DRAFT_611672 [Polyporus arcularius HHB13444]|uniref:Uncharacterized protein n=1 Tax=Polyporus arcularius HHB13444 TaxID=1314778 RepID=A0A5C3PJK6_9APHY|nr:hypothetical protein K466DRAFT_611672 [Polyporus arcularius HHB13444]
MPKKKQARVPARDERKATVPVNKYLESIASRPLYKNVTLRSLKALDSFSASIAEYPDRAASTQVLRLEWVEDKRILTPKSAPQWFVEMMNNLRDGKVEHLAVLVFPPAHSKTTISNFDQAVQKHVKTLRLKGIPLPKSVRTLETQAHLFKDTFVPVAPGQPLAPLVALGLRAGRRFLHLTKKNFPEIVPIAKTLRRLRISLKNARDHPLRFCDYIQPLSLANVEYLEVVHLRPRPMGPLDYTTQAEVTGVDVNEHLPGLRVLSWIPAWGDVQDLKPGTEHRAFIEHIRKDVFKTLKIRTFAVVLPRERCVRFEASDEEPDYSIVPKNSFDDLDWKRI